MSIHKILKENINSIINKNTNKLQILYIHLFKAKNKRNIESINKQISFKRNNEEIFDLICRTKDITNVHDYKILTDIDYRFKHMKINDNTCYNCQSNNIIYDEQKTGKDCGMVLANIYVINYNQRDNYNINM